MDEAVLTSIALLVVLGVSAQWLAWRLRLPSILLLLVTGFLAGPVLGWLEPDQLLGELLMPGVALAVALILFEGGLSLKFSELPNIGRTVRNLISVGALITWIGSTLAAYWILGWDIALATLFGALLVVTGPTVIIPLLRHVKPSKDVASTLKWEGILIDPIGALLAVLVFEGIWVAQDFSEAAGVAAIGFVKILGVGVILGLIAAWLLVLLLRRYWIPDYLQSPVLLMVVVGIFALSDHLQKESGLLAVTLMGIGVANYRRVAIKHIVEFKENLRVLLIAALFIILAARLEMKELAKFDLSRGLLFLAVLVLVIRPLAVWVATTRSALGWRERCFLAFLAPRGIVAAAIASLFALRLPSASYPHVEELVPATFLVIVGTVALYGLTASPLARLLGLAHLNPQGIVFVGAHPATRQIAAAVHEANIPTLLVDTNWRQVTSARLEGLSTYYGNILSEKIGDELDLSGFGRLFAMTPNFSVNSLAALRFTEYFGRSEVYQLATENESSEASEEKVSPELQGRILFGAKITYAFLEESLRKGGEIKRTPLTETFNFEAFKAHYGEKAMPLLVISSGGALRVFTSEQSPAPQPGESLVSLVVAE